MYMETAMEDTSIKKAAPNLKRLSDVLRNLTGYSTTNLERKVLPFCKTFAK